MHMTHSCPRLDATLTKQHNFVCLIDLLDPGAKEILQRLSEKQGKKMSSVESAQKIPRFLEFFKAWKVTIY